jgi:hypothetical protein
MRERSVFYLWVGLSWVGSDIARHRGMKNASVQLMRRASR